LKKNNAVDQLVTVVTNVVPRLTREREEKDGGA